MYLYAHTLLVQAHCTLLLSLYALLLYIPSHTLPLWYYNCVPWLISYTWTADKTADKDLTFFVCLMFPLKLSGLSCTCLLHPLVEAVELHSLIATFLWVDPYFFLPCKPFQSMSPIITTAAITTNVSFTIIWLTCSLFSRINVERVPDIVVWIWPCSRPRSLLC